MKYLKSFNLRLAEVRRKKKLTQEDVAAICDVDVGVVEAWESTSESQRVYPNVDHMIDLCIKAGIGLERLIDLDFSDAAKQQLELPGLSPSEEPDLTTSLEELQTVIEDFMPDEYERELLRRFRNSDAEKQRFILQLIGK